MMRHRSRDGRNWDDDGIAVTMGDDDGIAVTMGEDGMMRHRSHDERERC